MPQTYLSMILTTTDHKPIYYYQRSGSCFFGYLGLHVNDGRVTRDAILDDAFQDLVREFAVIPIWKFTQAQRPHLSFWEIAAEASLKSAQEATRLEAQLLLNPQVNHTGTFLTASCRQLSTDFRIPAAETRRPENPGTYAPRY